MLMPQQMQTETKYIGDLVSRDGTFLVGEPVKALFKHLHLGWMDGWWMMDEAVNICRW